MFWVMQTDTPSWSAAKLTHTHTYKIKSNNVVTSPATALVARENFAVMFSHI